MNFKSEITALKHMINIMDEKAPNTTLTARKLMRLEIMRLELASKGKTQ